jgi:acetyltransferase
MSIRHLDTLLHPKAIAVIGGSIRPGSLGTMVLANLVAGGFDGPIFAVNPKRVEHERVEWRSEIAALPTKVDLAIVVTPAATVPAVVAELGQQGVKVAVILSAGLHDPALRQQMLDAAKPHMLRVVGPNCLGILMPHAGVNASFAPRTAAPGRLAFVSQSGALVTAMLDWAADKSVGFSGVASVGDMADVDLGDLIDLFAADAKTDAILLYVEGVTQPAKFLSAARAASRVKPVIAIKAGRSAAAGLAALSHTGALAGSYDVYAAALRRAGIVLVDTLEELFDAAQILCRYCPPCGDRLAIVSNGGGAGVLSADALPRVGGRLAVLSAETIAALDPALPKDWSRANPVDVVGDARPERFAAATAAVLADAGADSVLVLHCPTAVATGIDIARAVIGALPARGARRKPVIACWMGAQNAASVRALFDAVGVPLFDSLDDAVRGYGYLLAATAARRALMRVPETATVAATDREKARTAIACARADGRTFLNGVEAKAVIEAYGVPVVPARFARTVEAVERACTGIAAPYAVKLISPQLPHKSDVGGVMLDVADAAEAMAVAARMAERVAREHPDASISGFEVETMVDRTRGHEVLVGIASDPTFGSILAFGAGGKAVEVLNDRALGLPPLDDVLAADMIAATRISHLLAGYRDVPVANMAAVIRVLNAVSAIAVDLPDVIELDINPLLVDASGVIALDVRIRISERPMLAPRLSILPFPREWSANLATRGGVALHVRPVRPDDEPALADFFRHVSSEDLAFRFLTGLSDVGAERLIAMTQIDYRRTMHFLAFGDDGMLIASALLASDPDHVRAELAISVRSDFKQKGVSWTLMQHVLRYAEAEGIGAVESVESSSNRAALALEREAGFEVVPGSDHHEVTVRRSISAD